MPTEPMTLGLVVKSHGECTELEHPELGFLPEAITVPITDDRDKDLVDFDGPLDPLNPINWSRGYKWSIVILLSAVTLIALVLFHSDRPRI